jgi:hypothetical protein
METIFFIMFLSLLVCGSIVSIFFPRRYLQQYRQKDVNDKNVQLLIGRGVILLLIVLFFIVMSLSSS